MHLYQKRLEVAAHDKWFKYQCEHSWETHKTIFKIRILFFWCKSLLATRKCSTWLWIQVFRLVYFEIFRRALWLGFWCFGLLRPAFLFGLLILLFFHLQQIGLGPAKKPRRAAIPVGNWEAICLFRFFTFFPFLVLWLKKCHRDW